MRTPPRTHACAHAFITGQDRAAIMLGPLGAAQGGTGKGKDSGDPTLHSQRAVRSSWGGGRRQSAMGPLTGVMGSVSAALSAVREVDWLLGATRQGAVGWSSELKRQCLSFILS